MGTMILAVMTRAILGDAGRELLAGLPTTLICGLIAVGAVLRVAAPVGYFDYAVGMEAAAIAKGGRIRLVPRQIQPILFRPRLDEASRAPEADVC